MDDLLLQMGNLITIKQVNPLIGFYYGKHLLN